MATQPVPAVSERVRGETCPFWCIGHEVQDVHPDVHISAAIKVGERFGPYTRVVLAMGVAWSEPKLLIEPYEGETAFVETRSGRGLADVFRELGHVEIAEAIMVQLALLEVGSGADAAGAGRG